MFTYTSNYFSFSNDATGDVVLEVKDTPSGKILIEFGKMSNIVAVALDVPTAKRIVSGILETIHMAENS